MLTSYDFMDIEMRIRETPFARLILWSHLFWSLCLSQFPPFIEENPQEVRLSFFLGDEQAGGLGVGVDSVRLHSSQWWS